MIITEPVFCDEVIWEAPSLWCKWQGIWKERMICTAHLAEARVFTCDFKGIDDIKLEKCTDFESMAEAEGAGK